MTSPKHRVVTSATFDDLPRSEQDSVLQEQATLDRADLAAVAGMTSEQLARIPALSSLRGVLRTPYPLLAAVVGYGHDVPAASLGEVLRRLGYTTKAGRIDKSNYHRARAAADYFGITLPEQPKDGPALGQSRRQDVEAFTAAWHRAGTLQQLAHELGQSASGKTHARNRARGAELGLPDKFSDASRAVRTDAGHSDRTVSAAQPQPVAGPRQVEPQREATGQRRAARLAGGCRHCGGQLAGTTSTGRAAWSEYCSDPCRSAFHEAARQRQNLAVKVAEQGPCAHCGASITPGARTKRFCSKSCAKKAAYRARTRGQGAHAAP